MRYLRFLLITSVILAAGCDNGEESVGTATLFLTHQFDLAYPIIRDITEGGNILVTGYNLSASAEELWVYTPDNGEWTRIGEPTGLWYKEARFSPDLSKIAFSSDYVLYVMDSDGGNIVNLGQPLNGLYGWINDEEVLLWTRGANTELLRVNVDTGEAALFLDFGDSYDSGEGGDIGYIALSPDGKYLAYTYSVTHDVEDPLLWRFVLYDMDTLEYEIRECEAYGYNAQFSPDSQRIIFSKRYFNGIEAWCYDLAKGDFTLYYKSASPKLCDAYSIWPGPFWDAGGDALYSFYYSDGSLKVYRITPQ